MKIFVPLVMAALFIGQQTPQQSDQRHNPQKLVSPDEYRNIPKDVRALLQQRHCQLPEVKTYDGHPFNVVSGHFARADQTDWAALCIVNDRARVVVLWGRKTGGVDEIHYGWALEDPFYKEPDGGLYLMSVSA